MNKHSFPEPADHDEYAELAAGWALHALEPDDETRFADHLPDCPVCQRAVDDYSGALAELSYLAPAVEPPAGLGERIRAEVARDLETVTPLRSVSTDPETTPAQVPTVERQRPGLGRASRMFAAAAAVIALVLGGASVVQYQRAQDAQERADRYASEVKDEQREAARRMELIHRLAQPGVQVSQLNQTGGGPAMAYVLIHDKKVEVLTDGMGRNNPTKEQYVLWMIGKGGDPAPMAKFDVSHASIDLASAGQLPSVEGGIDTFAVSIEPRQDGMPTIPTKVLADGRAVS